LFSSSSRTFGRPQGPRLCRPAPPSCLSGARSSSHDRPVTPQPAAAFFIFPLACLLPELNRSLFSFSFFFLHHHHRPLLKTPPSLDLHARAQPVSSRLTPPHPHCTASLTNAPPNTSTACASASCRRPSHCCTTPASRPSSPESKHPAAVFCRRDCISCAVERERGSTFPPPSYPGHPHTGYAAQPQQL
jgi:hypothetical protein